MQKLNLPYHETNRITNLVADICEQIGRISVPGGCFDPEFCKKNRIRAIQATLALDGRKLTPEEVTEILDGKNIALASDEITEVRNAYDVYSAMPSLNPVSPDQLLHTHQTLLKGLNRENGKYRSCGVSVFDGDTLVIKAPPENLVPGWIQSLFDWYQESDMHPLLRSAVFHYELELIHPFANGNGRMGRLWHTLLLGRWKELFYYLPIEERIRTREKEYNDALTASFRTSDCSVYVELMLEMILDMLMETYGAGKQVQQIGAANVPRTENPENTENPASTENPAGTENPENTKNPARPVSPESTENTECAEKKENRENTGSPKSPEYTENPARKKNPVPQGSYENPAARETQESTGEPVCRNIRKTQEQSPGAAVERKPVQADDRAKAESPDSSSGWTPSVQKLMTAMGDDVLTSNEIMRRLGLSHKPTFRKNYLNPAIAQKLIEMTIPEAPNSKNQKYRKSNVLACFIGP